MVHSDLLETVELVRLETIRKLDKARQSELGQFLSPPSIAKLMASMFNFANQDIIFLDAGAGVGTLTAALIARLGEVEVKPISIKAVLYELDPLMIHGLQMTLDHCQDFCNKRGMKFVHEIRQEDFIEASVSQLRDIGSFFNTEVMSYPYAILNPPYRKISSASKERRLLKSVGIETTNLYTAFLWLVVRQLASNGELVAIIPRSFCNGTYFRPFRVELLSSMAIKRIHVFESRKQLFKEDDVLQENIILHAIKSVENPTEITISSSVGSEDEDMVIHQAAYEQVIQPNDPDAFIHIVPNQLGQQITYQMEGLHTRLQDLGLTVSTGRVVDFRSKSLLRSQPDHEIIPLIYPRNLSSGFVTWPLQNSNKPVALASNPGIEDIAIPADIYVLVKRFSAKEEKRRISAAVYDPNRIPAKRVGFENHINYFHRNYGGLTKNFAKGLTLYLNSTLVDQYFRQFSGHTQVNAADLIKLMYPTEEQINTLGDRILDHYPEQDEIDNIIMEELDLDNHNHDSNILDPIRAKKRIREALNILLILNTPRSQQNDRSALTLLSLLNIKSDTPWSKASSPLLGITEMMNYFREYYGINYAPNTRETVRRQTVHQFIQMGLVVPNPDLPTRPINSPKTRYQIESSALTLIRTYGTSDWDGNLRQYFKTASQITSLQFRERAMTLIPVTMPDGIQIMLTAGGQNELIKKVIEEFCPRFTPNGKVIYVGDAGEKLNDHELLYFQQLGLQVDPHGKMPDVVIYMPEKNWLVLVEAVTSHGPIDIKRHNELRGLFKGSQAGLVFVTTFESRKTMLKYLPEIDWETEVWVSESPSHLIHFNGSRYLGPYTEE